VNLLCGPPSHPTMVVHGKSFSDIHSVTILCSFQFSTYAYVTLHTSDQRVKPVYKSHIALVLECSRNMRTLNCAIYGIQLSVHKSRYIIPKNPKNYQISLMCAYTACFFIKNFSLNSIVGVSHVMKLQRWNSWFLVVR